MIYVEMQGRCGNQLFRYAFARYLQEITGDELTISFNELKHHKGKDGWVNELENFNVVPYFLYKKDGRIMYNETNLKQKGLCAVYSFFLKLIKGKKRQERAELSYKFQKILSKNGIYWLREGYYQYNNFSSRNYLISGGFESKLFWENDDINIRNKIISELTPKKDIMEKNKNLYDRINESESVCVNVRRGDFLVNKHKKSFSVCTEKYFQKAYDISCKLIKNGKYFIFSDDIDWCKKNLHYIKNAEFVQDGMPPYETLRLMYSCKHFIISNSTFSWWGQYLSKNEDKIVISPDRWNNDGFKSPLVDYEKWVLIEP